jgi:hypothetical protein
MISDASAPFAVSLARSLGSRGWSVSLLSFDVSGAERSGDLGDGVSAIAWNRPSALSARTVAVALKNAHRELDQAVIVFDPRALARQAGGADGSALSGSVDRLVRGYLLLVHELASLFVAQGRGRLTLAVRDPDARGESAARAFPFSGEAVASVARGAFVALAEETAAAFGSTGNPALQTFLARLDATDDALNLEWLAARLHAENPARSQGTWVKAGSRGIFGVV